MKKTLFATVLLMSYAIGSHAAAEVVMAPSEKGAVWVFAGGNMYYCVPGNPPQCHEAETVRFIRKEKE